MPEFDLSKAPSEIAKLLLSRGSGTSPMQWAAHPNLLAKKTLDQLDNTALFAGATVKDAPRAVAVRALLYLYTGWPDEAMQFAGPAGETEKAYINALAERHRHQADAAKEWFQKLGKQAIFGSLLERARQMLRNESDPALKRFREIIEMNEAWEPYAFNDLYERACAGKLSQVGERLVCKLQDAEFELLFNSCYLAAVGRTLLKPRGASEADEARREQEYRRRMAERRDREERQRRISEARKAKEIAAEKEKTRPSAPPPPEAGPPKVKIICPKCEAIVYTAENQRGRPCKCVKCGVVFLVPHKKADKPPAPRQIAK